MNKMKYPILAAMLLATQNAFAAIYALPSQSFSEKFEISHAGENISVTDKAGKRVLWIRTFPQGKGYDSLLVVSQTVDRIVFDARKSFAAGAKNVLVWSEDLDAEKYCGRDIMFESRWRMPAKSKGTLIIEGVRKSGEHWWRSKNLNCNGDWSNTRMLQVLPADLKGAHLRYTITAQGDGPIEFGGTRAGGLHEMEAPSPEYGKRELLFHVPFDGNAIAATAKGSASPVDEKGLSYAEGKKGKAVRLNDKAKSLLSYSAKGNIRRECGSMSFWFKREWSEKKRIGYTDSVPSRDIKRAIFDWPHAEISGGGGFYFHWWGPTVRLARGDLHGHEKCYHGIGCTGEWQHYVIVWNESRTEMYRDGEYVPEGFVSDSWSPMGDAVKNGPFEFLKDAVLDEKFFIGASGGDGKRKKYMYNASRIEGLIDDFKIWSAPMSAHEAFALYDSEKFADVESSVRFAIAGEKKKIEVKVTSPGGENLSGWKLSLRDAQGNDVEGTVRALGESGGEFSFDITVAEGEYFWTISKDGKSDALERYGVLARGNSYSGDAARNLELELVETRAFDSLNLSPQEFRSVGKCSIGELNGVKYLEAGGKKGDRFAVRFKLDGKYPLYLFEIEWPDDRARTADVIIQPCADPRDDYILQVGYMTGAELGNTGKMSSHKCLYWTASDDVALVMMTANGGAPAAVSKIKVYKVKDSKLPSCDVLEPKMTDDGYSRHFGLYFEDPAINYDFAARQDTLKGLETQIDRMSAYMKYTGQDLFAYPGSWYHGIVGGRYNPRKHAEGFLEAYYAKFDLAGLSIMPTVNQQTIPVPFGLVTRTSMVDGSLHDSPVSIHDTGYPNWGGWHGTPPNFSIAHPDVRKAFFDVVDKLIEEGISHPSFKGICFHLTSITSPWWGSLANGYNDYCIEEFEKATKIKVPVDKKSVLRGRYYAEWLKANARNEWIKWRVEKVTSFYAEIAARLRARRADLKLWINAQPPHPEGETVLSWNEASADKALLEAGIDVKSLSAKIPNLIFGRTIAPSWYRHNYRYESGDKQIISKLSSRTEDATFYNALRSASLPWLEMHDTYWESPIGAKGSTGGSLSCDWLCECSWRVTAINPPGRKALRPYAIALKNCDVLGFSKGGFLIGSYGMESEMAEFAKAFRALPAVKFGDIDCVEGLIARFVEYRGRSYFYIVNPTGDEKSVRVRLPAKTVDLGKKKRITGDDAEEVVLKILPWGLRSYCSPTGKPKFIR